MISYKGKNHVVGKYEGDQEEEAAKLYDRVALAVQEGSVLNFLANGSLNPDR